MCLSESDLVWQRAQVVDKKEALWTTSGTSIPTQCNTVKAMWTKRTCAKCHTDKERELMKLPAYVSGQNKAGRSLSLVRPYGKQLLHIRSLGAQNRYLVTAGTL